MTDTAAGAVSRKSTATAEQMNFKTKEGIWKVLVIACGLLMIVLPLAIGAFLIYRGSATFTKYGHSVLEFLFSSDWNPADDMSGGGKVGAAVYIVGSLLTCGLALLISVPFSMAAAIFMTEIAPKTGNKVLRPAVEIFVGIPSVVYGWIGLTILVPFIRKVFNLNQGFSVFSHPSRRSRQTRSGAYRSPPERRPTDLARRDGRSSAELLFRLLSLVF